MDLKSLGQNTIIYAVGNIGLRLAAFILIPLYTYSLSITDYGILVTLQMTVFILMTIVAVGTPTGFMRFADDYSQKNLLHQLVGSTVVILLVSGLTVSVACLLFLQPLFRKILHIQDVYNYLALCCIAAVFQALFENITSYYRVKNEGIKFAIFCLLAFFLLFVFNYIFLRVLNLGVQGALLAQILAYGILWLIIMILVICRIGFSVSRATLSELFKFSFPLVFATTSGIASDTAALYLLSYLAGLKYAAIFSLAYKFAQITGNLLILPFQLAYEPFIYSNIETPGIQATISKILTYFLICFTFMAFGIAFASRDIIRLMAPPEYFSAYMVLFLLLPAQAFKGIYYIGESLLNIRHKTKFVGGTVSLITLISIVFNYLFIKQFGMSGAILAFNITTILTAVIIMIGGMKVFPIPLEGKRLTITALLLAFLLSAVFALHRTHFFIYYLSLLFVGLSSIAYVYFGNFCTVGEKENIKLFLQKLHTRFQA